MRTTAAGVFLGIALLSVSALAQQPVEVVPPPSPVPTVAAWDADKQPTSYRGVPFGASERDAGKIVSFTSCKDTRNPSLGANTRTCISTVTLATVPVTDSFEFWQDKLVAIHGEFSNYDISASFKIRGLFIAKYGPPTRAGSYGEDWDGPNCWIYLSDMSRFMKFADPLGSSPSRYGILTTTYNEAVKQLKDETLKKAKDAL